MRNLLLIPFIGLMLLCIQSYAQFGGESFLSVEQEFLTFKGGEEMHATGLRFDHFVSDDVSINWSLSVGRREDGDAWHIHSPAGVVVGPPLFVVGLVRSIVGTDEYEYEYACDTLSDPGCYNTYVVDSSRIKRFDPLMLVGIIATVMPEGVALHLKPTDWLSVSPYVDPLGLDYVNSKTSDERGLHYSISAGARLNIYVNETVTFAGFAEFKNISGVGMGTAWGISIGVPLN